MQYSLLKTKKKVQQTNVLVLNLERKDPNIVLVCTPEDNMEDFVRIRNELLKFEPNSISKVYFPSIRYTSVANQNLVKDVQMANQKFNELRTYRLQFNKITEPNTDLTKLYTHKKNILLDISYFRDAFNRYYITGKKSASTSILVFLGILKTMVSHYGLGSANKNLMTIYQVDKNEDPFLRTLLYAMHVKHKEVLPLLAKFNFVFEAWNTFLYYANFADTSDLPVKRKNLEDLISYAKAQTINLAMEMRPTDMEQHHVSDHNGKDDEPTPVSDNLDKDQHHLSDSENVLDDAEDSLEDKGLSSNSAEYDSSDTETEPKPEDKTSDLDTELFANKKLDLNFAGESDDDFTSEDEFLSDLASAKTEVMGATEIELKAIAKENEAFLAKNMEKQKKALEKFEIEANALAKDKQLDKLHIDDSNIMNENVKNVGIHSITMSYYQKQYKQDILNIIKSLNNDPEYPVIVTKLEITDASNSLSKLDNIRIEFLDKKYKKHTFNVDVPKLSNDGFLYVNGNKKFIAKQAMPIPVIKEAHDRVQITTNYRKVFLYRKGEKTSSHGDKLMKLLSNGSYKSIEKTSGDSTKSNMNYKVSITYTYLSKKLYKLTFKHSSSIQEEVHFNQKNIRNILGERMVAIDAKGFLPVSVVKRSGKLDKIVCEDIKTRDIYVLEGTKAPVKIHSSLEEYLESLIQKACNDDLELLEAYKRTKPSSKLSYTDVKIASTSVALGPLIAMYKGLLPALDLYGVKYKISDKRVAKKDSEVILAFKDVYIYIDTEYDNSKEIFVNGLQFLQTNNYELAESGMYSSLYLDYLEEHSGSRNVSKALNNFEHSMIDPITYETLVALKLPTNFPELLLYGNSKLGSLERHRKNDLSYYRIRDSEVLSVTVYNVLMDSFNNYKRSMRSGVVEPISAKRDSVISRVQEAPNVEDYSTLNPFQESEVKSKTTFKGPSGFAK